MVMFMFYQNKIKMINRCDQKLKSDINSRTEIFIMSSDWSSYSFTSIMFHIMFSCYKQKFHHSQKSVSDRQTDISNSGHTIVGVTYARVAS